MEVRAAKPVFTKGDENEWFEEKNTIQYSVYFYSDILFSCYYAVFYYGNNSF
jgi:hypothetical protein